MTINKDKENNSNYLTEKIKNLIKKAGSYYLMFLHTIEYYNLSGEEDIYVTTLLFILNPKFLSNRLKTKHTTNNELNLFLDKLHYSGIEKEDYDYGFTLLSDYEKKMKIIDNVEELQFLQISYFFYVLEYNSLLEEDDIKTLGEKIIDKYEDVH